MGHKWISNFNAKLLICFVKLSFKVRVSFFMQFSQKKRMNQNKQRKLSLETNGNWENEKEIKLMKSLSTRTFILLFTSAFQAFIQFGVME